MDKSTIKTELFFDRSLAEQIAGELEETLADVDRTCKAVDKCGLDSDPKEVYRQLQ